MEDAAIVLTHLTGYDKYDISSVDHQKEDYVAALGQPVDGLRIGVVRQPYFDGLNSDTRACMDVALRAIGALTRAMGEMTLLSITPVSLAALGAERQTYHRAYFKARPDRYMASIRNIMLGTEVSLNDESTGTCSTKISDYIEARQRIEMSRRTVDDSFANFDLVVFPTNRVTPYKITDAIERTRVPPRDPILDLHNSLPFNIFGLPALSLPCGFSRSGLPVGMTIAGPHFSEGKILALAHAYERATPWSHRRPSI